MDKPAEDIIQFLARYSVFGVLSGIWFAYIGDISLALGGLAGFCATLFLVLPIHVVRAISSRLAARRRRAIWDI